PPPAEVVGEPAAGVLIDRVEEVLHRAERPDRERSRAERLEILRKELLPQLLAEAQEEDGGRGGRHVPLEREVLDESGPPRRARRHLGCSSPAPRIPRRNRSARPSPPRRTPSRRRTARPSPLVTG